MANGESKIRLKQLDLLRAAAVVMVLVYHFTPYYKAPVGWLGVPVHIFFRIFGKIGWSGVDLFFVLSGFLVSGLLFKEYQVAGSANVTRFLARRGLKIYPQFYFFLFFTGLAFSVTGIHHRDPLNVPAFLSEILFVQNYLTPVWGHTWSLAVEEHFYLLLAFVVLLLSHATNVNQYRYIPAISLAVALFCLIFRTVTYQSGYDCRTHLFPTHLRIDSLMFGVFLSYLYHFQSEALLLFIRKARIPILIMSLGLLSVLFFWPVGSAQMGIFGLSAVYIGYGGVLLLLVCTPIGASGVWKIVYNAAAYLGRYSYAIYLWHIFVREVTLQTAPGFFYYLAGSMIVGIVTTHIIELPVLRIRDRFFPTSARGRSSVPVLSGCDTPVI